MSAAAVRAVIRLGREPGRLTDSQFRLLVMLADRLNDQTGQLNPSITTMATDMGRELDADATLRPRDQAGAVLVRQLLRDLEKHKELQRDDTSHKGGQRRGRRYPSQSYRLTLQGAYEHPTGGASDSPSGGASDSDRGSLRLRTGGASGSPNLGTEPRKGTAAKPAPSRGRSDLAANNNGGRVQLNDSHWRELGDPTGIPETVKAGLDAELERLGLQPPKPVKVTSNGRSKP